MTKQTINVGTTANDGTGDTLRTSAQKINSNFTEVYDTSQASFNKANTALTHAQAAFNYANTIVSDTQIDPVARNTANAGFLKANSATTLAQEAYNFANTIISDTQVDPVARTTANNASNNITSIQGVDVTQNTNITTATNTATAAFNQANTANVLAQAAFDAANTGGGADIGNLVIYEGAITTDGVSSIYIVPNGEGYAYVNVPNDASAANGAATVIGNGRSDGGGVQIQSYNNTWEFNPDGSVQYPNQATSARTGSGEALLFNKSNSQKLIGTKNGTVDQTTVERLVISGGDSYDTGEGYQQYSEGGDIYLWAGRGANGGDIKVDAGNSYGGDGDEGGTIKIRGGNSSTGVGGFVQIDSGTGGTNGGDIEINASSGAVDGGDISISAGYGGSGFGGQVTIAAGTGGTASGIVRVTTNYGNWDFGSDGLLTFPNGNAFMNKQRYGMGDLVAYHDGHWVLGEHNGDDFGTIGMRIAPGIEGANELILPSNSLSANNPVELNNYDNGGVRIRSNSNTWTFGPTGTTLFPNNSLVTGPDFALKVQTGIPTSLTKTSDNQGWGEGSVGTNLTTTGGTGTGLTVDVSDGGSAYASISINTPGTGYTNGDIITVTNGGMTDTFSISVPSNTWSFGADSSLTVPGEIKSANTFAISTPSSVPSGVADWNGGGGWNQGEYLNLATTGGNGTGLTVDVAAGGGGYINIESISINNPGSGYTDGDVITIENENNLTGTFTLVFGKNTWSFDANGAIEFPDATVQTTAFTGKLTGPDTANVAINLNGTVSVTTDDEGNIARWTYDTSGNMILPTEAGFVTTGTVSVGYYDINAQSAVGALASFYSTTANNAVVEITARNDLNHTNKVQIISDGATDEEYVNIELYDAGETYGTISWKFHNSGKLESAIGFAPTTSVGVAGDKRGMIIHTTTHMYFCTANYDGATDIWRRMEWNVADTW